MAHFYYLLVRRQHFEGLKMPGLLLAVGFAIGWFGVWLFESRANDIANPAVFWWYFEVTITTIGYGDKTPVTLGGRISCGIMILLTVFSFTVALADINDKVKTMYERRERGLSKVMFQNPLVVFGYHADQSLPLIRELGTENEIVLVVSEGTLEKSPLHGRKHGFVRGDIESDDVMARAQVAKAQTVIIDVQNDDLAFAIGVAVRCFNETVHIVVGVMAADIIAAQRKFARLRGKVVCVQADETTMLASEALHPGTALILGVLADPSNPGAIHRAVIPDGVTPQRFWDLAQRFILHAAALIGVEVGNECHVAPADSMVGAGQVVFYARQTPIPDKDLSSVWG